MSLWRHCRLQGWRLTELDLEQLIDLLGLCHEADTQSAAVLKVYLDRTQGRDWREQPQGEGAAAPGTGAAMTRDEALSILGLTKGVGEAGDPRRSSLFDAEVTPGPARLRLLGRQDQRGQAVAPR
jgi:hypothetical protein